MKGALKKKAMNEWRQEKNEHMYTIELNSILTLICARMQSITVIWAENFNEAPREFGAHFLFCFDGISTPKPETSLKISHNVSPSKVS